MVDLVPGKFRIVRSTYIPSELSSERFNGEVLRRRVGFKMFKTSLFLLCSMAILASGAEDAGVKSPSVSSIGSSDVTTHLPSNTSTPAPSNVTTSVPPITTDPPINTTTSAPTTTPTPTPAPTPAPTPIPSPDTGRWMVNGTNKTCIIARMALQFNLTYVTADNKTTYKLLNLPVNNTVTQGKCGSSEDLEQNITVLWNSINTTYVQNNLTLHFVKNITKNQYALHHLEVFIVPEEFPGISNNYSTRFIHQSDQFTTGIKNSYRCLKIQQLNLTRADNKLAGEINVSNLQLQAFRSDDTTNFGYAEDCAFDTPDIVPIVVGCALALLVVIVLIAYLVGRRRNQARGYLSM